jgi:hypothetical protein
MAEEVDPAAFASTQQRKLGPDVDTAASHPEASHPPAMHAAEVIQETQFFQLDPAPIAPGSEVIPVPPQSTH